VIHQVLQLHFDARLAGAECPLVLLPFGCGAHHVSAHREAFEIVFFLDFPHNFFRALFALPLGDNLAVKINARGHNVDMILLRPPMLHDDIGAVLEAHFFDVFVGYFLPLRDGQTVFLSRAERSVVDGFFNSGAQFPHEVKFSFQFARRLTAHIAPDKAMALPRLVLFCKVSCPLRV
jgi:hypothetical protein